MGIFDKKYCAICGIKIKLFGNRKLSNGNMCKYCENKLSPFFNKRRNSSVSEIKEQLIYRESNKEIVSTFNTTQTLNAGDFLFLIDDKINKFMITWSGNENPDVIDFSQVTGCSNEVDEWKDEIYREDKKGNQISYYPPRYEYYYKFKIVIYVNSPWFDEIKLIISEGELKKYNNFEYKEAERQAEEIRNVFQKKNRRLNY